MTRFPSSAALRIQSRRRALGSVIALVILGILPIGPAAAQEAEPLGYKRNNFTFFIGGATRPENSGSESAFTGGGNYEYRFSQIAGAGVLVEVATGDVRDFVVLAPLYVHLLGRLRFVLAPGAEIQENDTDFAFRLGVGLNLASGRISFSPEFSADFVNGDPTYVYGLSLGFGF